MPEALNIKRLKDVDARIQYVRKLKPFLKKMRHEQRQAVLEHLRRICSDVQLPRMMMSWKDLAELQNAGHYIGSHSATHSMLGSMDNDTDILFELKESAGTIEQKLGHKPLSISYPVGSYDETTKQLARQAGCQVGLAVKQTPFDPLKADIFEVPRIELYNEPWWKTRLRITHTLERIKSIIRYK